MKFYSGLCRRQLKRECIITMYELATGGPMGTPVSRGYP